MREKRERDGNRKGERGGKEEGMVIEESVL